MVIIAVHALCRFEEAAGRTMGHAPNESRVFWHVAADALLRDEPDEEEEDEEEHDGDEEDDDGDDGYSE